MYVLRVLCHLLLFFLLTILTQIGGVIYLLTYLLTKTQSQFRRVKFFGLFILVYLLSTFFVVPYLAPFFGREKVAESDSLKAHSFIYKFANRNYVSPELNKTLLNISDELNRQHKGIKVIHLDANFPFINGFPLIPHLSHSDGKKIDLTFIYEDSNNKLTNLKPSNSGYGVFVNPIQGEKKQTDYCLSKGYWQYDYPKYLTFGNKDFNIHFSQLGTKSLINDILNQNSIQKLFIEPHLKERMNFTDSKIRFHGCRSVRHDDHIHLQIN